MCNFSFQSTSITDLMLITPLFVPDQRGFLTKTYEKSAFEGHGIHMSLWEELRSCSQRGVLRGLHFQIENSQDKLVQVLHGAVYDVAVDLRRESLTFGKWEGFYLSAENQKMLYIPRNFAHGFLALEENTIMNYLCGNRYDPESSSGIRWNDPELAIQWPLEQVEKVILSDKDAALPTLAEL